MLRRSLLVLLLALALGGCTRAPSSDTGNFTGEEAAVAEVVGELSDAAGRREPERVCDLLSSDLEREIAGDGDDNSEGAVADRCELEVEKALDDADVTIIDVDEVTVEGAEATAEVSSEVDEEPVKRTFDFVKVGGDWRLSSFG